MKPSFFKTNWILLIIFAALFSSSLALSEAKESIHLDLPKGFFAKICPSPIWKNLKVRWLGVTDERPDLSVGIITKKGGKDPFQVLTEKPLAETLNTDLQALFSQCGMIIVDSKEKPSGSPQATLAIKTLNRMVIIRRTSKVLPAGVSASKIIS